MKVIFIIDSFVNLDPICNIINTDYRILSGDDSLPDIDVLITCPHVHSFLIRNSNALFSSLKINLLNFSMEPKLSKLSDILHHAIFKKKIINYLKNNAISCIIFFTRIFNHVTGFLIRSARQLLPSCKIKLMELELKNIHERKLPKNFSEWKYYIKLKLIYLTKVRFVVVRDRLGCYVEDAELRGIEHIKISNPKMTLNNNRVYEMCAKVRVLILDQPIISSGRVSRRQYEDTLTRCYEIFCDQFGADAVAVKLHPRSDLEPQLTSCWTTIKNEVPIDFFQISEHTIIIGISSTALSAFGPNPKLSIIDILRSQHNTKLEKVYAELMEKKLPNLSIPGNLFDLRDLAKSIAQRQDRNVNP